MLSRRHLLATATLLPIAAARPAWALADDDMAAFVAALPKAEYHLHLEGTLEADMKFAMARRNGITLPYANVAEMQKSYVFHDLPSFLKIYYEGNSVLLKEQDFYDLCYAYLAKAASQNVLYTEMFFDPQQHVDRGIPYETVITGLTRARRDAAAKLGIRSQLILCFMRDLSAASAMSVLEQALPFKEHIVGVGLDSDEKGNPPAKFAAVFATAKANGLKLTLHCDIDQTASHENIRQAIEDIGVRRIDHGGNILERPDLVAIAKRRDIVFNVCPGFSGWLRTGPTPVNVLRGMIDRGLKVTISSDDPAYMGGDYITQAMLRAQVDSHLTKSELVAISRTAFDAAWIGADQRAGYLAKLDAFAKRWNVASYGSSSEASPYE